MAEERKERRREWGNPNRVLGKDISDQEMLKRQRASEKASADRRKENADAITRMLFNDLPGVTDEARKGDPMESIVDAAIAKSAKGKDILSPDRARALRLGYHREPDGSYVKIRPKKEKEAEAAGPSFFGYKYASDEEIAGLDYEEDEEPTDWDNLEM